MYRRIVFSFCQHRSVYIFIFDIILIYLVVNCEIISFHDFSKSFHQIYVCFKIKNKFIYIFLFLCNNFLRKTLKSTLVYFE